MKQKAMDGKLVVRPLIGCLTHTHFWEGPCRAGHKEDMTVEAETKAADETFKESVEALKGVIDEVQFTEPMDVRYDESFVVKKDLFEKIGENLDEIDCFLCMGWRIPKLERYNKPVIIWQNGNEGIDFAAYCRSIGVEAYVPMRFLKLLPRSTKGFRYSVSNTLIFSAINSGEKIMTRSFISSPIRFHP